MKNLKTFVALSILLLYSSSSFSQKYSKCKIYANDIELNNLSNMGLPIDHGIRKKNTFYISDFSENELNIVKELGINYEILIDDVSTYYSNRKISSIKRNEQCINEQTTSIIDPTHFHLGSMGGFYTYNEFLNILDEMKNAFPNLISEKAQINNFSSIEGRAIYYLKISDNPNIDENEPEVLYTSVHHAREPISLTSTIYYMWYLLENYSTNPEIKRLVDESEMYFIPMVNPDGYIYNETSNPNGGGMWRKNRRNNNDGNFGVDLNRNYSHQWGTTGISFDTSSDIFPGANAFSEPETQAVKWFCSQRDFKLAFNAHSYSNLLLFPIGSTTDAYAEDHDYFQTLSNEMVIYNGFVAEKSSTLYPASGDSDDYMYLEDLDTKPKIFAMTPEIGNDNDGFWPSVDRIIPLCHDMLHPNLTLVKAVHNFWLINENNPQNITDLNGLFHYNVKRLGLIDEPVQVSLLPIQNVLSTGNSNNHTGALTESITSSINYTLSNSVQLGDTIKFLLKRTFNNYELNDTVFKIFGTPTLQFVDNCTQIDNWTGNWELSTNEYVSAPSSFTESASGNYDNNSSKVFQYIPKIDLTNSTSAKIEFNAKWSIENNYDYCSFEVSLDSGLTWIPQCGKYTNSGTSANGSIQPEGKPIYDGTQSNWILEEISLNDYLGEKIYVRFILKSDGGVKDDGFYFDDFKIYYNQNFNGINDINESTFNFKIFPNPNNGNLILSSNIENQRIKIIISDINGKNVFESIENPPFFSKNISLSNLENGSYFLNIIKEDLSNQKIKIIVLR